MVSVNKTTTVREWCLQTRRQQLGNGVCKQDDRAPLNINLFIVMCLELITYTVTSVLMHIESAVRFKHLMHFNGGLLLHVHRKGKLMVEKLKSSFLS
jgi:hypothetical protein